MTRLSTFIRFVGDLGQPHDLAGEMSRVAGLADESTDLDRDSTFDGAGLVGHGFGSPVLGLQRQKEGWYQVIPPFTSGGDGRRGGNGAGRQLRVTGSVTMIVTVGALSS